VVHIKPLTKNKKSRGGGKVNGRGHYNPAGNITLRRTAASTDKNAKSNRV